MMSNLVIVGAGLSGLSVLTRCRTLLVRSHDTEGKVVIFDTDFLTTPNLHRYPRLPGMKVGKLKAALARQFLLDAGYQGTVLSVRANYSPDVLANSSLGNFLLVDCSDSRELKSSHLAGGDSARIVTGLNRAEYWAAFLPPNTSLAVPLLERVANRPSCGDQQANALHLAAALKLGAVVRSLIKITALSDDISRPIFIAGGGNSE